jgi:hypothetical protein
MATSFSYFRARVAGALAERFGNRIFAPPQPRLPVIRGVYLHDSGWPLHDLSPTLNSDGLPLDVFETPIDIAATVWTESVRLALEADAYSGFLVSLHVFSLSAHAYQHFSEAPNRRKYAKEIFMLNKFQQLQIETQEKLRRQMGLRTDVALELGLASGHSSPEESLLAYNYHLLRAMDQISLSPLCSGQPFQKIETLPPKPGANALELRLGYPHPWTVSVTPWPFDVEQIDQQAPCRRLPVKNYASVEEFREAYASAPVEMVGVRVMRWI